MSAEELKAEIDSGVEFYGWYDAAKLLAVMGIQPVKDVTLIRHAYVRADSQRRGIGEKLLYHLISLARTQDVYVGTWKAASWAIRFYEKNGFRFIPREQLVKLRNYWTVSEIHAEASIVLKLHR
jgi:GNAT superfamily N-acetyltransferase